MVNRYVRKLLSIGIPLSHPLCFPDLLLYVALQRSCSCTERSMSMEFFPMCLTPTLTKYLHKFLGSSAGTGSLICQSIVLHWGCPFGIQICHHTVQVVLNCSLCRCTGLPQMCYGGSSMSLNPGIVPLLSCPLVEVSQLVLGSNVLVQWVYFARFAGCIGWNFHWDHIRPVHFLGIYIYMRWSRGSMFDHLFCRF